MSYAQQGLAKSNIIENNDSAIDIEYQLQTLRPTIARKPAQSIPSQHQDWCNEFKEKKVKLCLIDGNNGLVFTNLHRTYDLPTAFLMNKHTGLQELEFYSSVKMLDTVANQNQTNLTAIAFEFYHAMWYDTKNHKNHYEAWLKQLGNLHDLSQVIQVEFKRVDWGDYLGDEHTQEKTKRFLVKLLTYFPGMTELILSDYDPHMVSIIAADSLLSDHDMLQKCNSISNRGLNDLEIFARCRQEVGALLLEHRNIFNGGVVPNLHLIDNYAALMGARRIADVHPDSGIPMDIDEINELP